MQSKVKVLILLFLVISLNNLYSLDVTAKELEGYFRGEYTRGSDYLFELSTIGTLELDNTYSFKSGVALGRTLVDTQLSFATGVEYTPFDKLYGQFNLPLSFSAIYLYNGFFEYNTHVHSVLPFVSYNTDRAGLSLGTNFRFTRFFGEKAQNESVFSFYCYYNFIKNDSFTLGIACGNFNDFNAKNFGAFSYNLYAQLQVNDNWLVTNHIELQQSGVDGLSATFYGMAFRTGVKYSW